MSSNVNDLKRKLMVFELYFVLMSFLLIISLSLLYYITFYPQYRIEYVPVVKYVEVESKKDDGAYRNVNYSYIKIPAVMDNDSYAYVLAEMYAFPGKGNVFINVKETLIGQDTQQSIRKAIRYALKHEGLELDKYDFIVNVKSNAAVLTGPSAGATFAVLAIATLRNKIPNQEVMMTGTISNDGTIGLSGKIYEKAVAAKSLGAKLFLVPKGLSMLYDVESKEDCDTYGDKYYCDVVEYANIKNLSAEVGIIVVEVENVEQALQYFGI